MTRMLIFQELHDSSMCFTSIIPKTSHYTIHKSVGSGTQLTFPITMGNNTIFLFQKV